MPIIPDGKYATLTNSSVNIINAIRNSASQNYRDHIPYATPDAESIRKIGAVIMDYPALQNEFLSALINRIGLVYIKSKSYKDHLAMFKKGFLEFGETIEEIFVDIARVKEFDPAASVNTVFAREIPDVKSAFHTMNYQKYYKATVSDMQLKQAFLSWSGLSDLIAKITESMYNGMEYDEEQTMLYMIARHIIDGQLFPKQIANPTTTELQKDASATIKEMSTLFDYLSRDYNLAGVATKCTPSEQTLIISAKFNAQMDTNVLASAFNLPYADYLQRRVVIPSFGALDIARLNELFANDPNYEEIGSDTLTALDAIPAVLLDNDWFMVWDNMMKFTEIYNSEGLYWNYSLHVWKTFSVSPFANNVVFLVAEPTVALTEIQYNGASISSETGTPTSLYAQAEGTAVKRTFQLSTDIASTTFAPLGVKWEITTNPYTDAEVSIDQRGILYFNLPATATLGQEIKVKATSMFDTTQTFSGYVAVTTPA